MESLQDVKNTTSEFFDTLERITNELRGMTVSHMCNTQRMKLIGRAGTFHCLSGESSKERCSRLLQQYVTRPSDLRIAEQTTPVVKHPMDLGTVLKKVKAQQYKDKKAFKADLDLIWDNCLLYNTLAVCSPICSFVVLLTLTSDASAAKISNYPPQSSESLVGIRY